MWSAINLPSGVVDAVANDVITVPVGVGEASLVVEGMVITTVMFLKQYFIPTHTNTHSNNITYNCLGQVHQVKLAAYLLSCL